MFIKYLVGIIILCLILSAFPVNANLSKHNYDNGKVIRYVGVYGDDLNADGTRKHPFKTFSKAVEKSKSGDIIQIESGNYKENNIKINKDIVITGIPDEEGRLPRFNGQNKNCIMCVNENVTVTISNLEFIHGNAGINGVWGGAITNKGDLTVINCAFKQNTGYYYENLRGGAAVYNEKILTVVNSKFINNNALAKNHVLCKGGAIFSNGFLNIENCIFKDNYINKTPKYMLYGSGGGAVYSNGTTHISGTIFESNRGYNGGALAIEGFGTIKHCNFIKNKADSYGSLYEYLFSKKSLGGAIFINGNFAIHYCNIVGNKANYGNAIFVGKGNVDARFNWWGKNINPRKVLNIPNNRGYIKFEPYLDGPVTENIDKLN